MIKANLRDVALHKAAYERRFEKSRSITLGLIASQEGSVEVINEPGKAWVSEWGNPESKVPVWKGGHINYVEGTPVEIGRDPKDPFKWQIIGLYDGGLAPGTYYNTSLFTVGPHGQNHQMPSEGNPGTDPVLTYQPAWQPLKTTGNGDLTITTQSHIYLHQSQRKVFPGQTSDLTGFAPGTANRVRVVLVYLDKPSNTLKFIAGTQVVNNGVVPIPYPDLPSEAKGSAYVKLITGQTAIITANHVEDFRDTLVGSSSVDDVLAATAIGQVPFSIDGVTFSPQLPLTTLAAGWLVGGDGILMV